MTTTKTRKFYKKRFAEKEVPRTNINELKKIRTWFLTGSFSKKFLLYETFDKSKIYLLRKYVTNYPIEIEKIMNETYFKSLNKNTFIYTLVLLSNGSFLAKKIFKNNFEKVVQTPKQIYLFLEYCKEERGRGKSVQNAIKDWFKHKDIHKLEKLFIEEMSGYNWTAKDVMRIIKPSPRDKKENLLFKWLSNNDVDYTDYGTHFPLIYFYEKFRQNDFNKDDVLDSINNYGMKNTSIPGNVFRDEDIIRDLVIKDDINSIIKLLPRYIDRFSLKEEDVKYIEKNIENCNINDIQLISIISKLEGKIKSSLELKVYDILLNTLIERIKKQYDNSIHIIDTNARMLDNMEHIGCNPARIASSIAYKSNNIFNFDGEKINKNFMKLFEGEGFTNYTSKLNYDKIFEQIDDIESKNVFIWSNDKYLKRKEINSKFQLYKSENGRVLKVCFINLYNWNKQRENKFFEIYGVNFKTERLINYLINKEI